MTDVSKIGGPLGHLDPSQAGQLERPEAGSFKNVLGGFLKQVNDLQLDMDEAIKKLPTGQIDVHQVMIAAEEADIAFQLMMKIRSKLLKAYEEVMKMSV